MDMMNFEIHCLKVKVITVMINYWKKEPDIDLYYRNV